MAEINREATAFLVYVLQILHKMPRNENLGIGAKYSNTQTTPHSATTVPLSKFNVEKNAKNEAYHFILAYGLSDLFLEFCKEHRGQDHHAECLKILLTKIQKVTK